MMNCPKCGSNVNQGEMFCRVCGAKIVSQSVQPNQIDNVYYSASDTASSIEQKSINSNN